MKVFELIVALILNPLLILIEGATFLKVKNKSNILKFYTFLQNFIALVIDIDTVEQIIDRQELSKAINSFVKSLSIEKRNIFVRRYWYADSVSDIASDYGMLQGTVSKTLERTRKQLKAYLTERGFEL